MTDKRGRHMLACLALPALRCLPISAGGGISKVSHLTGLCDKNVTISIADDF